MSDAGIRTRSDLEAKVVARAQADESFRERLKADPRSAIAEETGVSMPESMQIEVLEETPEKAYLVIPASRAAVPDEELDFAAGISSSDTISSSHLDL
jgi:hypothetical protein